MRKWTHGNAGARHGQAKLREGDALAILRIGTRRDGLRRQLDLAVSNAALAHRFGVSPTTVSDIINRARWAHVSVSEDQSGEDSERAARALAEIVGDAPR